jgi:exopolysaccharide production protein ExoY
MLVKRSLDVVLSLVVLLLATPLLVSLAAVVRATSPGPALFRQQRVGRHGRHFSILKIRTMVSDAEAQLGSDPALLTTYAAHNFKVPPELDRRLTRVGRVIRRASLDELPQLLNVLRGDMSLVGPRPVVPDELEAYGEIAALYLEVRPGITGWWQVQGRSEVRGPDRIELDRHYLEHRSLWLDVKILLLTLPAVFRCRGAH